MTVFIGRKIDFNNEHSEFLKDSYIAKELFSYIIVNFVEKSEDKNKSLYFVNPVLKGFLENIIKNDLPLQAVSKIDHKWLIDKNNSENVKSMFYKIYFPPENDLVVHKIQIEEAQSLVNGILVHINTWIFQQSYDPIEYLKEEFIKKYNPKKELKNSI